MTYAERIIASSPRAPTVDVAALAACADACLATGKIASRQMATDRAIPRAALAACKEACPPAATSAPNRASTG